MSGITHAKVSTLSDGANTDLVRPSDWNAEHVGGVTTYAFAFDWTTPNLLAGVPFYVPTIGEYLLDFRVATSVTFLGSAAAKCDFGQFSGGDTTGLFDNVAGLGQDLLTGAGAQILLPQTSRTYVFQSVSPLELCVSTTGLPSGLDSGLTQGAAVLIFTVATPVPL